MEDESKLSIGSKDRAVVGLEVVHVQRPLFGRDRPEQLQFAVLCTAWVPASELHAAEVGCVLSQVDRNRQVVDFAFLLEFPKVVVLSFGLGDIGNWSNTKQSVPLLVEGGLHLLDSQRIGDVEFELFVPGLEVLSHLAWVHPPA